MRWPRPRFTVRRLMIAIAILALCLGAVVCTARMRVRSAAYQQRAKEFAASTGRDGSFGRTADGREVNLYDNENDLREDEWAWGMAAKYLRLSYYPWLAAQPDPPPPPRVVRPRNIRELPAPDESVKRSVLHMCPPTWTFLWTWPHRGPGPWE